MVTIGKFLVLLHRPCAFAVFLLLVLAVMPVDVLGAGAAIQGVGSGGIAGVSIALLVHAALALTKLWRNIYVRAFSTLACAGVFWLMGGVYGKAFAGLFLLLFMSCFFFFAAKRHAYGH